MCAAISRRVDPWKAASQVVARGLQLEGRLEAPLPRLEQAGVRVLAPPHAELRFENEGAGEGAVALLGWISVPLRLTCQRCLEDFDCEHRVDLALRIVAEPAAEEAGDAVACEPGGHLDMVSLMEDELLLALPFSPRCGRENCEWGPDGEHDPVRGAVADGGTDEVTDPLASQRHPFAVLASLRVTREEPGPTAEHADRDDRAGDDRAGDDRMADDPVVPSRDETQ